MHVNLARHFGIAVPLGLDLAPENAGERSSLPSKNFPCISMDMLQIGALVLLRRLVEATLDRDGTCGLVA